MANTTPPADGSIDTELLRDKYTGRQRLFWNQENQSGRKWNREALTYKSPELQLDPRVQYRTAGPRAYDDFLKSGIVRGTYQDHDQSHAKLFASQGAPLWSYGEQALNKGENAYMFATLGENWGNRDSNIQLTPHDVTQLDMHQFELTTAFTKEEHKQIDSLRKSILQLRKKAIFDEKQTGILADSHTDANVDYILRKHEGIIDRISSSMSDVKALRDGKKINDAHPMSSWMDIFEGKVPTEYIAGGNANPRAYQLQAGGRNKPKRYAGAIEIKDDVDIGTYSIDTHKFARALDFLKPSVSGNWGTENILPLGNYLRQLQSLHKTDLKSEQDRLVDPTPKNPFLSSGGWNPDVTTVGFNNPNTSHPNAHLYNSAGEHPADSTKPLLDSYYDYVHPTISPNLVRLGAMDDNSPAWASPESISKFLTDSLKNDVVYNNGHPFPLLQSNFLTHGIQGAMHTERVPRAEVRAFNSYPWDGGFNIDKPMPYRGITDEQGNPRIWDFAAQSFNAQNRPMAVFRINPDHPEGFELIHEFNNDPLPDGTLPIPTKAVEREKIIDSAKRFLTQEVPKLSAVVLEPEMRKKLLAGESVAGLQDAVAAGRGLQAMWHQMGPITDPDSFYGLQNVVNESTRGNPNYGRKGFVDSRFLTKPLEPFANVAKGLAEEDAFVSMLTKGLSNPTTARNFANNYVGNQATRALVNAEMGASALKFVGKLGAGAAIATAPFSAIERRDRMLSDWLAENKGQKPHPFQKHLGWGVQAGLENALAVGTLGISDDYLHPEWREPIEPVQRGFYSDNGQRVPNWIPNLQSTYLQPK